MSASDHRVSLQPAFILHGRDYRDSSRLLDVFSRDYGRVTLVAKGVRSSRSKLQGLLIPFTPLLVSWSGKGEVQTLTGAESVKSSIELGRRQLMSGYYMNELLQRLTTAHDPHPDLYDIYEASLKRFASEEDELILRHFEKQLLASLGYALNLLSEVKSGEAVEDGAQYYYDVESGPVRISEDDTGDVFCVSGKTLLELENGSFTGHDTQRQAKQLMRIIMSHYLGDKPLKTRSLHWYKTL